MSSSFCLGAHDLVRLNLSYQANLPIEYKPLSNLYHLNIQLAPDDVADT